MSIDQQTVAKIAKLAHIDVAETDLAGLAEDMSAILRFAEQLDEVDTQGTEPLTSAAATQLPMRGDVLTTDETGGGRPSDIVANAPKTEDHFFVVPKVVE